jgi:hypothetical protein
LTTAVPSKHEVLERKIVYKCPSIGDESKKLSMKA